MRLPIWCCSFALASLLAAQESKPTPASASDLFGPGWRWELKPTRLQAAFDPEGATRRKVWSEQGQQAFVPSGSLLLVQSAAGRPIFSHLRTKDLELRGSAAPEFRPVLLLEDGSHLTSVMSMGQGRADLQENRYVFAPPKDAAAVDRFALAILDFAGKQERARVGAERALALGASVLPLPRLGEALAFDLPALTGERVRAQELLGKVVLIDCWATW